MECLRECIVQIDGRNTWMFHRNILCDGYIMRSALLVCPFCARVWARIFVNQCAFKWPVAAVCEDCQAWEDDADFSTDYPCCGSILQTNQTNMNTDWSLLASLPVELIQREFELHLAQAERKIANERST